MVVDIEIARQRKGSWLTVAERGAADADSIVVTSRSENPQVGERRFI